jgi:hypothetical protein
MPAQAAAAAGENHDRSTIIFEKKLFGQKIERFASQSVCYSRFEGSGKQNMNSV